jgi:hypothetical protein
VVCNNDQDRGEGRHWNEARPTAEEQRYEEERKRVDDARDGCAPTVLYIRGSASDGSRRRNPAEEWRGDVCYALRNELHVRAVAAADHAISHNCGQQRLYRGKHGNRERWSDKRRCLRKRNVGQRWVRERRANASKAAADGLDRPMQCLRNRRGHQQGNKGSRDAPAEPRPDQYDRQCQHAHGNSIWIHRVSVSDQRLPLLEKVRRHGIHMQAEEILDLTREDDDRNTARKSHHDGVWHELYHRAESHRADEDEKDTCHESRYG